MVHWGESEILSQLGRTKSLAENESDSRLSGLISPRPEHQFHAGRKRMSNFYHSLRVKPKFLRNAKSVANLWSQKSKDEENLEKLKDKKPKDFQMKLMWYEIMNVTENEKNYCQMCKDKIERSHKRSRSI